MFTYDTFQTTFASIGLEGNLLVVKNMMIVIIQLGAT